MRLLFINQFFWPDASATSQLLTDLVRSLAPHHDVVVICGCGGYAAQDNTEPPRARIIRVSDLPFGRGRLTRVASYATFLLLSMWRSMRLGKFDVVVTMTTPPLLGVIGAALKRLFGSRHYIWEMDLYPDVAVVLGAIRENSIVHRLTRVFADDARRQADGVIALGECMRDVLLKHNIPEHQIQVVDNWADASMIYPAPMVRAGPLTLQYSGNLGLVHEFDTICSVMETLRGDHLFSFQFSGSGPQRQALQRRCVERGITNAAFLDFQPLAKLRDRLNTCDIGLVTQRVDCLGLVVPSKVYGLMAAGRPILFIGPAAATPARIIDRFECGWNYEPGHARSIVDLLLRLVVNRSAVEACGARARQAFEGHYDKPIAVSRICQVLGTAVATASAGAGRSTQSPTPIPSGLRRGIAD